MKRNVRINITCAHPVEIAYYGTGFGRTDICPYCLAEDVQINSDLRKSLKLLSKFVWNVCKMAFRRYVRGLMVNSNVLFNDNYWQTKMSRILFKSIYNSQTSLSLFNIPGDTASGSC